MGESFQTKRLSTRERQTLEPHVRRAEGHDAQAREAWTEVGRLLDSFDSKNHSQCCPIGGMRTGGRSGFSGTSPCPCGWGTPETSEEVLRRMIAFVGRRFDNSVDGEAADILTDALAALNRAKQ